MKNETIRVLIIEDEPLNSLVIRECLLAEGNLFEIEQAICLADGLARLEEGKTDVVLLDLGLPDSDGLETLREVGAHSGNVPVIVLTGSIDINIDITVMKAGAQDFLSKGFIDLYSLPRSIRYAIERMQLKRKLSDSERILNETGKMAKIGGWEHDLSTGKATWTQALFDIIEIPYDQEPPSVEEHLGYYPPHDRKILEHAYHQAIKKGWSFDLELQVHTARKKLFWCRVQGGPVLKDGKCVKMCGIFQDITDRKKATQILCEIAEKFRNTFEQVSVGMAHFGSDGHFIRVNKKFSEIIGFSPEVMITKTFQEITHPDDLKEDLAFRKQILDNKIQTYSMEKRYYRKDRSIIWCNLTVSLVRKSGGEPDYFIAVVEDISARKQMEARLLESETRYRMLFELSADGIIVADADLKKINYANKAMGDMLGYHPEELVGMALADIHTDGALPAVLAPSDPQASETKRLVSDIPCLRKDCAIIFADINATTMTIDGRRCAVGFFRDITDRKTAEELKKTTRELQAFNEAMIGREERIIKLKEEVNRLARELGRPVPYDPVWEDENFRTDRGDK